MCCLFVDTAQSSRFLMSIGALFGSNVGLSLLSETVRQMALIRSAYTPSTTLIQLSNRYKYF